MEGWIDQVRKETVGGGPFFFSSSPPHFIEAALFFSFASEDAEVSRVQVVLHHWKGSLQQKKARPQKRRGGGEGVLRSGVRPSSVKLNNPATAFKAATPPLNMIPTVSNRLHGFLLSPCLWRDEMEVRVCVCQKVRVGVKASESRPFFRVQRGRLFHSHSHALFHCHGCYSLQACTI